MPRRLFTLISIASLLLLMAISTLWLRSYSHSDNLTSRRPDGLQNLHLRQGHLVLHLFRADCSNEPQSTFGLKYQDEQPAPPSYDLFAKRFLCPDPRTIEVYWKHAGFTWYEYRRPDGIRSITAIAPFWSLALAAAVLPLASATLRLRSRRQRRNNKSAGLCPVCDYDLRATPHRCPECGTLNPA